jgi:DNA repair protein RecN (Recombination protein N)
MLLQLRVENYAVIDQATVDFGPGLNLLTGETGAGKSILIDALALLLGEKASSDVIRHGAERAVITCAFDVEKHPSPKTAGHILDQNGIDPAEDGTVILRREILANGKGRVFINNQPATVAVLKQLAPALASIHAQNESILAFDAAARLAILDRYAGISAAEISEPFARVRKLRAEIDDLLRNEQDRLRLLDLWKFQNKEIADARLEPGEDQRLETEKRVLANAEKLYAAAMGAYDALYEGNVNVASLLRSAERNLAELARYDENFQEPAASLATVRASIEDVSATVRAYAEAIDASPERLAEIEDRLALLDRLKRKYGSSIDDVIVYGADVLNKLQQVENRDEALAELQRQLAGAARDYLQVARAASQRRHEAAPKLEKLVEAEINDLAMRSKFRIELQTSEADQQWSSSGIDAVAYLISMNPGEPMKPIEEIASGGEMSRVMLALKASVEEGSPLASNLKKRSKHQRTLVFDEIDTGIGGRAAEAVGKKLKSLARTHQVLCITHLPQIASFADQHFVIEKREAAGRARTSVRALTPEERTEEVARMLSGAKLTETSLKHAEQMLKTNA